MILTDERVWAGSEANLKAVAEAEDAITRRMAAGATADDDEEDSPRLLSVDDGVATVAIKGRLVNSVSCWNSLFGLTGYAEIRDALVAAAEDPDVKHILLDIDSGGGAVSGCDDTAKLIRTINDRVKPVTAFTDGAMFSAAYWLGCAAGEVYAGKSAGVGSIGVISTHAEYSEMHKKSGVGVTVVRAGKYKALANSNEPLTAEGRAQIQAAVDSVYGIFVEHVSTMRGRSYEYADKQMADGKEFFGQAAADVGLVDRIATFDEVVSGIREKSVAKSDPFYENANRDRQKLSPHGASTAHGDTEMKKNKKPLTEADIAAIAAGVAPQAGAETQTEIKAETPQAGVDNAAAPQAGAETQTEVPAEPAAAEQKEVASQDASVQFMLAQVREKDAALLDANMKLAKAEERVAEFEGTAGSLLEIAAQSISHMSIALNGPAFKADGLTAVQVLAEHSRVSAQFKEKFKVGGVAAVSSEAEGVVDRPPADALAHARLQAVTNQTK